MVRRPRAGPQLHRPSEAPLTYSGRRTARAHPRSAPRPWPPVGIVGRGLLRQPGPPHNHLCRNTLRSQAIPPPMLAHRADERVWPEPQESPILGHPPMLYHFPPHRVDTAWTGCAHQALGTASPRNPRVRDERPHPHLCPRPAEPRPPNPGGVTGPGASGAGLTTSPPNTRTRRALRSAPPPNDRRAGSCLAAPCPSAHTPSLGGARRRSGPALAPHHDAPWRRARATRSLCASSPSKQLHVAGDRHAQRNPPVRQPIQR